MTTFIIQRKEDSGSWIYLSTNSPNDTTYSDNGVEQEINYSYRVYAYNDVDTSAFSNTATAITYHETAVIWAVNSLGETLSKVDLESQEVVTNAIILDSAPNDIVIKNGLAYVVNSLSGNVQIIDLTNDRHHRDFQRHQSL
jgi:hypothetical protein